MTLLHKSRLLLTGICRLKGEGKVYSLYTAGWSVRFLLGDGHHGQQVIVTSESMKDWAFHINNGFPANHLKLFGVGHVHW